MTAVLADEVKGAQLGDMRLTNRLQKIVAQLGSQPQLSIPAATDGRAEMEAAYRFFDNPKVSPEAILHPHRTATLDRARNEDVLLLVQDTTEVDLTRPTQQVSGAGFLDGPSRHGVFYHPLMAFTASGVALGTVWSQSWIRDQIQSGQTATEKALHNRNRPIEEKESMRWLEGVRAAREVASVCPQTQCVCIADSEADIYDLFAEMGSAAEQELHLLVRGCHDRVLADSQEKLLDTVRATDCLYQCHVDVSSRRQKTAAKTAPRRATREARIAEVEVRATAVTLRPPRRVDRTLPEITLQAVLVEETNAPQGAHPIQWCLLTTLPIDAHEQVKRIVEYYCVRWQIEIYFRTLKSGCRIESRYFQRIGRLSNCLVVYSIIAWKILYLCRLGRDCPDVDCEVIFSPCEWQAVYLAVRKQPLPEKPPTLNEMIRLTASLGGYVIRKNTNPGTQTLWLGLQRVHDLATAWNTFGPKTIHAKNISENTCVVQ